MAISSVSATAAAAAALGSLSIQAKPKRYLVSFSSKFHIPRSSISSATSSNARHFRAFVAPEQLESEEIVDVPLPDFSDEPESIVLEDEDSDGPETSAIPISADFDAMWPKQKIRIKLKSYFVPLIEDSAKQIIDAAKSTNAKAVGPVPLPTKKRIYCLLKSPHVHKDARFHFEIRTHQRLIDIAYPTAQTIDALMQLDLPAGVDVQVKL